MTRTFAFAAAIAAATLGGGATLAFAQPPAAGAPDDGMAAGRPMKHKDKMSKMMRADKNGDGVVTRAEAMAEAGRKFDKLDANRDGRLEQAEMARAADRKGHGGKRRLARADMAPPANYSDDQ